MRLCGQLLGDFDPYDKQERTLALLSRVVGDVSAHKVPVLQAGVRAPGAKLIRPQRLRRTTPAVSAFIHITQEQIKFIIAVFIRER
jgi:hypothetical protein